MNTLSKSFALAVVAVSGMSFFALPAAAQNTMNAPAYYRYDSQTAWQAAPAWRGAPRNSMDWRMSDPRNSASKDGRGYTWN